MIIISDEHLQMALSESPRSADMALVFASVDGGDVFVSMDMPAGIRGDRTQADGVLKVRQTSPTGEFEDDVLEADVEVTVWLPVDGSVPVSPEQISLSGRVRAAGGQEVESRPVQVVRVYSSLVSRIEGIYKTEVLRGKCAMIVGLGSGGSLTAVELAKAGVGKFILIDHDRLEPGNLARHICGISDVGRMKTRAVKDAILEKNPWAVVETHEAAISLESLPWLTEVMVGADIVFGCTDNRASRVAINLASLRTDKVAIYGGAFTRAYGGQVLRVIPRHSLCYQCFIDTLVDDPEDQEIESESQARELEYGDRSVPVEPGLATDIAPITLMCVKIGILEMLRGSPTRLESLYEDLQRPLYQWLNRREPGTDYAEIGPLDADPDGLRILAWYGISGEANPGCPACGDFVGIRGRLENWRPGKEDIAAFSPGGTEESMRSPDSVQPPLPSTGWQ